MVTGLAVAGRRAGKDGETSDYLLVNNAGTQVFFDDEDNDGDKAMVTGLAVAGRRAGKEDETNDYLTIKHEGTTVYINEEEEGTKSTYTGFAVAGRSAATDGNADILKVTQDSTRVYVSGGGSKSGFGVEGKEGAGGKSGFGVSEKGANGNAGYMDVTAQNFFAGYNAGEKTTSTGVDNTFVGNKAGIVNTTGKQNVFIGKEAGYSNTISQDNVFIGTQAGYMNTGSETLNIFNALTSSYETVPKGSDNVFIGNRSGYSNTTGSTNVFVGNQAGARNSTGSSNVFLGIDAGLRNNNGDANVFIGNNAGAENTSGGFNVFLGNVAGRNNIEGKYNVALGFAAGSSNENGDNNVFLGYKAGNGATKANNSIVIGYLAGEGYGHICEYSDNVFIGTKSGACNTGGSYNVFLGNNAGKGNSTGEKNVFIGDSAGVNNINGSNNVVLGKNAAGLMANLDSSIVIGVDAGKGLASGFSNSNVFIGSKAGYSQRVGRDNVFIGKNAGYSNESGYNNLFFGSNAGRNSIRGFDNVFIGKEAGYSIESGDNNLFFGNNAGRNSKKGNDNIFIGNNAGHGQSSTLGDDEFCDGNIAIGKDAAYMHTRGSGNVYIGENAGYENHLGEGNVFIGNNAGKHEHGSHMLYISSSEDGYSSLISGSFLNKYVRINNQLYVDNIEVSKEAKFSSIRTYGSIVAKKETYHIDSLFNFDHLCKVETDIVKGSFLLIDAVASTLKPYQTSYDLGASDKRWNGVYASTINTSGDATVGSLTTTGAANVGSLTANGNLTVSGLVASTLKPSGTSYDLGGTNNRWNGVYASTINVSGNATLGSLSTTGTATVGSISTTGSISGGDISGSTITTTGAANLGSLSSSSISTSSINCSGIIIADVYMTTAHLYSEDADISGKLTVSGKVASTLKPNATNLDLGGSGSYERWKSVYANEINASSKSISGTFNSTGENYGNGITLGGTQYSKYVSCGINASGSRNGDPGSPATNFGIYAYASGNGYSSSYKNNNYAIYAKAEGSNANNYAGYFEGLVNVTGQTTVGSLSTSGSISGGAISGSSLSTSGDLTVSGSVASTLKPSVSGSTTVSTYDLGGTNNRWNGVYASTINTSGAATVGSLTTSGDATVGTISASNTKTSGTFTSTGNSYGSDGIKIGETTFTNKVACGIYAKASGGGTSSAGATNIGIYAYATGSGKSDNVRNKNYAIYAKASGNNADSYAGYFENTSGSDGIALSAKSNNGWAGYFEGNVYLSNSYSSSDSRLKKDVQTIDGALGKVLKLRGVSYYWKNKAEMGADSAYAHNDTEKHIGVIAQEIEQEFPELVKTDHHGYKTVEYSAIAPILIEAVKELKAEKDALQAEKDALEAKVEKLEAQMQEILEKLK